MLFAVALNVYIVVSSISLPLITTRCVRMSMMCFERTLVAVYYVYILRYIRNYCTATGLKPEISGSTCITSIGAPTPQTCARVRSSLSNRKTDITACKSAAASIMPKGAFKHGFVVIVVLVATICIPPPFQPSLKRRTQMLPAPQIESRIAAGPKPAAANRHGGSKIHS